MMNSVFCRTGRSIALAVFAVLVTVGSALAQAGRIEGTVTNAVTGERLAGVLIAVRGTPISVTTDDQGSFVIANVTPGTVSLTIRLIGYQVVIVTRQPVSTEGTTLLNFRLQPSVLRLNEIVVTGVAEATQGVKLPFTVDVINASDLVVKPTGTPEEAIRGKVAGAKIVRTNGEPGGGVSVLLRGATSIDVGGRTQEPLYVVDGVILGSSMVDIDALDIETIEVLKGAAAASLYGARAANGVISIRTNRGANLSRDQTRIVGRAEFGANYLGKKVPLSKFHAYLVDPTGNCSVPISPIPDETGTKRGTCWIDASGAAVTRANRKLDQPFGVGGFQDNEYQGELFDHLDLFFNPGTFATQSLSVAHRTGNTNFNTTFTRTREGGIISGLDGFDRKSFRVNLDHSLADDLEVSISAFYSNSSSDGNPAEGANNAPNPLFGLMFLERDNDLLAPNADGTPFNIRPDPNALEENPLYATHNVEFEKRRSRTLGNMRVRWFPVTGFDLEGDFSFDRSDRNRFEFYHKGFKTLDATLLTNGLVDRNNEFDQALNASLTARYSTRFGDYIGSTSSARVLVERSEFEQFFARAQDLIVNNVDDLDVGIQANNQIESSSQNVRSLGYFISQDFDISDRYILSGLIRRDGSSLFGKDQRWHTYYRLGGAYRLSQESWWPFGVVDEFKLRYSRGTAGGRPRFTAQYEVFNVSGGQVSKGSLGNTELKPEFATENEYGFDMILGGRVQLTGTYAQSTVQDQILRAPLPGFFGFSTQWQNAGTLQSKTFEASLQADIISTRSVSWNLSVVWDRTRQKITKFDIPAFRFGSVFYNREGEDFGTMYGARWMTDCSNLLAGASCDNWAVNSDGFLVPVGAGNTVGQGISDSLWGTTVTDADGATYAWGQPVPQDSVLADGTRTSDFLRIGNTTPDWNLGFSQTFRLNNLSVYTLFDAQIGGDVYNGTKQWGYRDSRHGDADQFGKPDELKKPADYYKTLYNTNQSSGAFVEDATFLKFRELSVRYAFDSGALQGILGGFANRLTLSVVGRNLFTWTGYTGFDPEVGQNGSNAAVERRDQFNYPNYRTFTGAIEIEF